MTRRNPERPPGPSYYRLPEASWTMIRDEYLSGWTAKEIGRKWRVSPTSVYRHASDGGWNKYDRGQAFHDQIVAEAAAAEEEQAWPREDWTSLKDPVPPSMRRGPPPLPGMGPVRRPAWEPPAGYGPMPPHLVPPVSRPPSDDGAAPVTSAEVADQAVAAAGRALSEGRYAEAERLGKLAETMRRQAGSGAGAKAAPVDADDEDEIGDLPLEDRPVTCTPATCYMQRADRELEAKLGELGAQLFWPASEDVLDWAAMADAMGVAAPGEDARLLIAALRREGPAQHRKMLADFGISARPR